MLLETLLYKLRRAGVNAKRFSVSNNAIYIKNVAVIYFLECSITIAHNDKSADETYDYCNIDIDEIVDKYAVRNTSR